MQITLGRSFIASRSLYWRSWTTRICRMEVVTIGILRSVFVTASANMRFHLVKCASIPMTDLLSRRLWPGQIYVTYPRTQDVCSVLSITLCWIISIVNADAKISALLCNNDHLADPRCWSSTGMMTPRLISLSSSVFNLGRTERGKRLSGLTTVLTSLSTFKCFWPEMYLVLRIDSKTSVKSCLRKHLSIPFADLLAVLVVVWSFLCTRKIHCCIFLVLRIPYVLPAYSVWGNLWVVPHS